MSELEDKLKELILLKYKSLNKFCEKINIPRSTLQSIFNRGINNANIDNIIKICNELSISVDRLADGIVEEKVSINAQNTKKSVKIKVLGKVQAGIPVEAIEDIIDEEEITEEMARTGEFFGLKIKGNSMSPGIEEGDVVIVRKQEDIESGETAIVIVNGNEATCKKIKKLGNGIMLIPANQSFEPFFYTNEEIENLPVRIIGKVVELRRKF